MAIEMHPEKGDVKIEVTLTVHEIHMLDVCVRVAAKHDPDISSTPLRTCARLVRAANAVNPLNDDAA